MSLVTSARRALKRVLSSLVRSRTVTYRGMSITGSFSDYGLLRALATDSHESFFTNHLLERLPAGGTFVDVGAHLGKYTLLASQEVGPEGTVFAFEPHPRTFEFLRRNVRNNGLEGVANVVNAAASNQEGELVLNADFLQSDFSSVAMVRDDRDSRSVVTRSVRVSDELPDALVDCVKMDVEGWEVMALDGCRDLIERSRAAGRVAALLIECNPSALQAANASAEELLQKISDLGYVDVRVIDEQKKECVPLGGSVPAELVNLSCS